MHLYLFRMLAHEGCKTFLQKHMDTFAIEPKVLEEAQESKGEDRKRRGCEKLRVTI